MSLQALITHLGRTRSVFILDERPVGALRVGSQPWRYAELDFDGALGFRVLPLGKPTQTADYVQQNADMLEASDLAQQLNQALAAEQTPA